MPLSEVRLRAMNFQFSNHEKSGAQNRGYFWRAKSKKCQKNFLKILLHYATILKNFGIEEIREILCTLQAHYVFCMHLWDVIIHI